MKKLTFMLLTILLVGCSTTKETTQSVEIPYKPPAVTGETTLEHTIINEDSLCRERLNELAEKMGNWMIEEMDKQGNYYKITSQVQKDSLANHYTKIIKYWQKVALTAQPKDTTLVKPDVPLIVKVDERITGFLNVEVYYLLNTIINIFIGIVLASLVFLYLIKKFKKDA